MTQAPISTTQQKRRARRALLVVRVVFFTGVIGASLWVLASVVVHLVSERDPLHAQARISRQADRPEEIFACYFDTMLLFHVLVADHGRIPSTTRCQDVGLRGRWGRTYGWDTHPWYVVLKSNQATPAELGHWRYQFYEVWSRCRLNDPVARGRNPVLAELARAHQDLDELRRALTRQVQQFQLQSEPLILRIRKALGAAERNLDGAPRRMQRERKLIKYRLRRWGIHRSDDETCAVGF